MKVKELDKTVNLAWSPAAHVPVMLAAGSAAQQLDASFSTAATLDIYNLNLNEPGLDMELKSSIQSQNRFHKLVWGACGSGVIVGGCDSGRLQIYNASKVLLGEEGLLCAPERHTGHVKAIDFNPFQANLLSSGASESEIFIWDLNNVKTPMTPGAKSQPAEEVLWLSWNKQVQHILASVFPTRCVVWDLRKNEPIIKLSDSNSRVRWKEVAWHPDVATQLCLASEDDSNPVIQLWDLRFATTPIKTLEGHQKGVLSIAWCSQDPELLVSCGKDSRILCWNPGAAHQGEEIVCEIMTSNQWNFEVSWCPRNPSLIATSSFDGHASVFSLVGGQQQMQTTNKIADSFPGMEQYAEAPVVQPPHHSQVTVDLRKAPKWLKRPAGASFGFGGKLVSFSNESQAVYLSQVVTEPALLEQSQRLQQLLAAGQLREICHSKSDPVWTFVAASLEPDCRTAMRTLLGFTQEQLELNKYIGQPVNAKLNDIDGLTDEFSMLSQDGSDDEGRLMNNSNSDIKSFNSDQRGTTPLNLSGEDQHSVENKKLPFKIKIGEDKEGVICRALLAGNVELAVDLCVQEGRMTDAIILAATAGPDLLASTQYKYFQQNQNYLSYLLSAVVTRDWSQVVSFCDLSSWAEALAAVLTYASDDQLPTLCERLGDRLEREGGLDSRRNSEICFVAAGQLGHLIQNRIASDISTDALQELVELVLVARRGDVHGGGVGHLLDKYAQLLAAQGDFGTALMYLSTSQEEEIDELRERLHVASGQKPYPTSQVAQNSYYQTSSQGNYGSNYSKPMAQPLKQQLSHHPATTPPSNVFHAPTNQYPPGNAPFAPAPLPSVTPPRKPSLGNPLVSSFQASNPPAHNNFGAPPSSLAPSTFPSVTSSSAASSFPPSQSFIPSHSQPQPLFPSGPTASLFTQSSSAFAPPPPSQKPPPTAQAPPSSRTPVHFNSEQVPPPSSSSNQPQSNFSHRSSPSPSIGGGTRKYVVDPSVGGGVPPFRGSSTPQFNSQSQPYSSMPTPQPYSQPAAPLYNNNMPAQPFSQSAAPQYTNNIPPQTYGQATPSPYSNIPPPQSFNSAPQNQSEPKYFVPQTPAAPGWNDPPTLASAKRVQPKEVLQHAPITHPLFQSTQDMPMQGGPGMMMEGAEFQSGYSYGGAPPLLQTAPPAAPPHHPPPPVAKAVEPPQPKPPLPEEHMYLQTVFEELRNRCTCAANNPQLRRKLEDVSRKLEVLYDSLRENKMSAMTLKSLHQLVQFVQGGDYTNALKLHTQLVSGPDFSQISAFMPGLKVLIQSALQLGVYLQ